MKDNSDSSYIREAKCVKCGKERKKISIRDKCWKSDLCGHCYHQGSFPNHYILKKAPSAQNAERHRVIITEKNIDLYCKLSKIIRGKPCSNKKHVLARQSQTFSRPVLP